MTDPIVLLQILWTGAVTASSYVLLTVAFSLTQKVTGLWNFAQAGTMGIAFYTMFFILNDLALPISVALPVGAAFAAAAGIAIEAWGLDVLRARRSGNLTFFIFTLILAELVIYILTLLFGTEPQTLFTTIISPVHIVGGIAISDWDLRAVGISVAALVGSAALPELRQGRPVPRSPSPTTPSWLSCTASAHAAPIASPQPSPACSSRWRCTSPARAAGSRPTPRWS